MLALRHLIQSSFSSVEAADILYTVCRPEEKQSKVNMAPTWTDDFHVCMFIYIRNLNKFEPTEQYLKVIQGSKITTCIISFHYIALIQPETNLNR